ncbi:MAG TPA: transglycosylase [bacterium (Candidatus Stahlbacteria)]|nr:transglycosylase [Candidatus Stahlbacteria bacterium]
MDKLFNCYHKLGRLLLMKKLSLWLVLMFLLSSCVRFRPELITQPEDALVCLKPKEYPQFSDDEDLSSLKEAIRRNFRYLNQLEDDHKFVYGPDVYTVEEIKESLRTFSQLITECGKDVDLLNHRIREEFVVYRAVGNDGKGDIFFTGYYVPVLHGSLKRSKRYCYPLYRPPNDRIVIDLGLFREEYKGQHLVARHEKGKILPYYTHEDIVHGALKGRGLELVWVDDRLDLFFLQVQGSGIIELDTGDTMFVGYAGSNGHPYRSIGKLLVNEGKLTWEELSMQSIKRYLHEHPEEIDRVLFYNPSYVFFQPTEETAIGYIGVPLVDGRAIATDRFLFPQGALAYVQTVKPQLNAKGEIKNWIPLSRFVLNQDTGGAIRGPGRVDFFWGKGKYAEIAAGHMKEHGFLYFLVKKKKVS